MARLEVARDWRPGRWTLKAFEIAAILVAVQFVLLLLSLFAPTGEFDLGDSLLTKAVFGVGFLIAGFCIIASFYIWIGMLWFLVRYDRAPLLIRVLWFPVILFGLSYGAAAYYLSFYRKYAAQLQSQHS